MEQMIIIMNCSTNIMDTGNKVIIVCEDSSDKLFPFDNYLPCLLPIGNKNSLIILLESIRHFYDKDIIIIAPQSIGINKIAEDYDAKIVIKEENYLQQIYNNAKDNCTAIFKGELILHLDDVKQIFHQLATMRSGVLIQKYDRNIQSIDTIGVQVDHLIKAIYAHPREHYVNAYLCGAYVLDKECMNFLQYSESGFHNINCGQMPDDKFYLEEALQNAIEANCNLEYMYALQRHIVLSHAWDIREANELICKWIHLDHDEIGEQSFIDDSCIRNGFVQIGCNSIVKDGVIFEGDCIIGDNVVIEKGAIIGNQCIIGNHSILQYHCKINAQSVIGPNNKIGFNAEISGVTFDGVCAVHNCEVFGIIGKRVDIAAGVQMAILRFDDMYTTQSIAGKKYSTPYTNNICIGDYCRTGVNNVFLPGVKIGSRSALGPCLMIDKDIAKNSLIIVTQETIVKDWGSHRYGW